VPTATNTLAPTETPTLEPTATLAAQGDSAPAQNGGLMLPLRVRSWEAGG
jgi:hypothetical protein